MKQARLAGRLNGLRPSQQRRLESLSHRRHPEKVGADQITLERLAGEVVSLEKSLHIVLDSRGLCRLLCVGPLDQSKDALTEISQIHRRKLREWRLISCLTNWHREEGRPSSNEALTALDFNPISWLRFASKPDSGGQSAATLWQVDSSQANGWKLVEANQLAEICLSLVPLQASPHFEKLFLTTEFKERVLLLSLTSSDKKRSDRDLAELEGLVRSAGANPVSIVSQKKGAPNPQTIWGKGKLKESAFELRRKGASMVITDRELTPAQARNLEQIIDSPVMDRSELILDIFAQRASSSAGRLQVELAQLRYRMPRLIGRGRSLSRQGGGIGTRGPGETQLEKDRRTISRRIDRLREELLQLKKHRSRYRKRRNALPRVALVGYTNVGKSSLMNALCCLRPTRKVLAEDKLFATLDTTTRRLLFPQNDDAPKELLITDTVGFIRELPEPLLEAFRATLEETLEADLLLIVVDLSNPDWLIQLKTVNSLLDSLGANGKRKVVANQIDRCGFKALELISDFDPKVLYVSATSGAGLNGLKLWLQSYFWGGAKSLLVQN